MLGKDDQAKLFIGHFNLVLCILWSVKHKATIKVKKYALQKITEILASKI